ncbi:TPA: creatininase family protein [Candidatus Poribacteria bacterium]|nr:creatininase family protein [Candidatus Poribacteria bacterium]HEX29215.1 creatininase family protein [Candidatus Poribacteria bacterium]
MSEKVFLDEMTWCEAREAIERGAPAFLPTGPVEGHGPHVPLGCDYYIATAFSVVIAQKCGGVVLPPLTYNFTGATSTFKGAVSIPIDVQVQMLKAIIRSLWRQGLKYIFVVSVHGPNGIPIGNAVRSLFEDENIPAVYLNPWGYVNDEKLREKIPNYDDSYKEAMLAYAAAKILGKERAIPDLSELKDEEVPEGCELPESFRKIGRYGGMVGYHYTHELQHIPPRAGIDPELGLKVYEETAERMLPVVDALREYVRWLEEHPRRYIE